MGKRRFVSTDEWMIWDMLRSSDDIDREDWDADRSAIPYPNVLGIREWPPAFGSGDYGKGETQAESLRGKGGKSNAIFTV